MLTDFTPGGLVTEYTVSQNSPNRIALKISTFLFWPKVHTCAHQVFGVFYHARPVWLRVQLAAVCKFWQRLCYAWLPFLKRRQHFNRKYKNSHFFKKAFKVIKSCHGTANLSVGFGLIVLLLSMYVQNQSSYQLHSQIKKVSESTHHRVVNIFWHAQISKQHECCSILCFIAGSL